MATSQSIILLIVCAIGIETISRFPAVHCDDSTAITEKERGLIKRLWERVRGDLTQEIMHKPQYLVRFLRAQNNNLDDAEGMIRRNLIWRNETQIDTIFDEDWSQVIAKYPFSLDIRDFEGRSVLSTRINSFDMRKIILAGKQHVLNRYIVYIYERGLHKLNKRSAKLGKEFVDGHVVFNLAGFNSRAHACLLCVSTWLHLIPGYDLYNPYLVRTINVINTPKVFQSLYAILSQVITPRTFGIVYLHDFNRAQWRQHLFKLFPEDVLPIEYGGTGPTTYSKSIHSNNTLRRHFL